MTIREYAEKNNFKIVGKLVRHAEWENAKSEKWYTDEANNEYYACKGQVTIVASDGGII